MENQDQALSREVDYPKDCKSDKARKKYKKRILRQNPHTLYADYTNQNERRIKNDLVFYTPLIPAWRSAICHHYNEHVVIGQINEGEIFDICYDELLDTRNFILKLSSYTTGTVLVQGDEASLNSFEKIFPQLISRVENERENNSANPLSSHLEEGAGERNQPTDKENSSSINNLTDDFSNLLS